MVEKLIEIIKTFNYDNSYYGLIHSKSGAMEYYSLILDDEHYLTFSSSPDIRNFVIGKISLMLGSYSDKKETLYEFDLNQLEMVELREFLVDKYNFTSNKIKEDKFKKAQEYIDSIHNIQVTSSGYDPFEGESYSYNDPSNSDFTIKIQKTTKEI